MASESHILDEDPVLVGAVSKIMLGSKRTNSEAFGTILSVEECQVLWKYFQEPGFGFWREKRALKQTKTDKENETNKRIDQGRAKSI